MFVIFSNLDFKDLVDINFFKNNQQILNNFKSTNISMLLICFSIFSIIWIVLMGFATPLALVSGFIFGKWLGTFISVISFSIGCTLFYYLANFFFKEFIKEKLSTKIEKFINLFNKNDFLYFMLFRFIGGGGMPFVMQNIVPVIFGMKLKKYFLATFLGLIPTVFILNLLGSGVGNYLTKNDSIIWINLITDPEIYIPIFIFILLLIIAAFINKVFFSNKLSK